MLKDAFRTITRVIQINFGCPWNIWPKKWQKYCVVDSFQTSELNLKQTDTPSIKIMFYNVNVN